MLPIQVRRRDIGEEERRSTAVGPGSIGHRQDTRAVMFQRQGSRLIRHVVSRSPRAGSCRISALRHEIMEHPMKGRPIVIAFSCQEDDIVHSNRRLLGKKLDLEVTFLWM